MKNAYETVVGPTLNIEFMFSEALKDTGAMTTFIENAYAAGCQGVIVDLSSGIDQAAAVCNDLGMWFVGISSADAAENMEMENMLVLLALVQQVMVHHMQMQSSQLLMMERITAFF